MVRGLYGISRQLPPEGWLLAELTAKQIRRASSPDALDRRIARWVFSGGTSLTAAWGLVDRFSEDIDANLFAANDHISNNAVLQVARKAARWISDETGATRESTGLGNIRRSQFTVPGSDIVFMGDAARHGPDPDGELLEVRRIRSIIARTVPELVDDYPELGGFLLPAVVPHFTAVNKLDALNRRNAHEDWRGLARRVRDVVDLAGIAGSHFADDVRNNVEDFVGRMTEGFGGQAPRPDSGYGSSSLYVPETPGYETLREAYSRFVPRLLPVHADSLISTNPWQTYGTWI